MRPRHIHLVKFGMLHLESRPLRLLDIDPRLEPLWENTALHVRELAAEVIGRSIEPEFRDQITRSFLYFLTQAISQPERDILAELDELLADDNRATLRALIQIGMLHPESADDIQRRPWQFTHIIDQDIRQITAEDIRQIPAYTTGGYDSSSRNVYVDDLICLKAFVRTYEESGRRLETAPTNRHLTQRLRALAGLTHS